MYNIFNYELDPINGCLYLRGRRIGSLTGQGYIQARVGNSRRAFVHRMIYEWVYGPVPDNYVVDHIDANRSNNVPWNLQAITNAENTVRTKQPKSGHHHIYVMPNGSYSVQIKTIGKAKRFKSLDEAIIYRDNLLELREDAKKNSCQCS